MSDDAVERLGYLRLVANEPAEFFTEIAPDGLWDESCGPFMHEYVSVQECRRCGSVLHPEEPA